MSTSSEVRPAEQAVAPPEVPAARRWRPGSTLVIVAVLTVAAGVTVVAGDNFTVFLACTTLLACIGAMALGLLMGTAGQVSIGNSAFLAAGSFAAVWATRLGLPFPLDVVVAIAVCALVGVLVGLPALRIRGIYLALATLAAFYLVLFVTSKYQSAAVGSGAFTLEAVLPGTQPVRNRIWIWVFVVVVALCLVLVTWLRSGRSGRAWRMIRDHEVAAPMTGVPVARYKLLVFVISSALIGLQGALTAHFVGSVSYETFTLNLAVSYIAMILIGGADSKAGPIIGAVLVTLLPVVVPDVMSLVVDAGQAESDSGAYAQIAYGVLVIVFIVFSPRGVNGWIADLVRTLRRRRRDRADARPASPVP